MHPLLSTVATLILFFGPGLLFVAVLGGSKKKIALTLGEQLYLLLATSLLLSGWVGLFLAELGRFSSLSTATLWRAWFFWESSSPGDTSRSAPALWDGTSWRCSSAWWDSG